MQYAHEKTFVNWEDQKPFSSNWRILVMASFGIEGVRHFSHARAAGVGAEDLTYVFNNCNGMDNALRSAGHSRAFYFSRNRLLGN